MQTYIILRRNGFASPEELERAGERSTSAGDAMADDVRWIRTYVLDEEHGIGTVCVYQASSPEAIRKHGLRIIRRAWQLRQAGWLIQIKAARPLLGRHRGRELLQALPVA